MPLTSTPQAMHNVSEPAILYFGTPVVVISTVNDDGSANLAPMSSAFWLGWRCVLGLGAASQTARNLRRSGHCVLNLPSQAQVSHVDRLALTTGADPVPPAKAARGYRHVHDKFAVSGFTPEASQLVAAPRVRECPVQLEAVVESVHGIADGDADLRGRLLNIEVRVVRVHLDTSIVMDGLPNRVDPDKWRPLIMSFQKFYGLSAQQLHPSALSSIEESMYRSPDVDRARQAAQDLAEATGMLWS
jgi:flavin reductase (DIM6/NTAB) family NADH-FMN oxidoreductase RutF